MSAELIEIHERLIEILITLREILDQLRKGGKEDEL